MDRPCTAVLLAGTLRPSPLQASLNIPVLGLPVGSHATLLDAWLDALDAVSALDDVRLVLDHTNHSAALRRVIAARTNATSGGSTLRPLCEPSRWRGVGGILHDVTSDLDEHDETMVIVLEAFCLPPRHLERILTPLMTDTTYAGAVGVAGHDEPAGVAVFHQRALRKVPGVGYYDLKEQLIPDLVARGDRIKGVRLADRAHRIRDRRSYLAAVREGLQRRRNAQGPGTTPAWISPQASISSSAVVTGSCLIEDGVVIEDGAVVHDSVVLTGATIGGGAIVSRSVIGPRHQVDARTRLVREMRSETADIGVAGTIGASTAEGAAA